jgi:cell division protein FtsI/penicillin-binding protein 2
MNSVRRRGYFSRLTITVCAAVIVFTCAWTDHRAESSSAFHSENLDVAARAVESKYGECAVVILDCASGRIEYIYNRRCAVERRFPPGSLMKPLSAVVLLDHGRTRGFSPMKKIRCEGYFIPKGESALSGNDDHVFNIITVKGERAFKCSLRDGHGDVDLGSALSRSCNVYFLTQASIDSSLYNELISLWALDADPETGKQFMRESCTPFQRTAASIGEGGAVRLSPLKVAQCYAALLEGTPLLAVGTGNNPHALAPLEISEPSRRFVLSSLSRTIQEGTLKNLQMKNARILGGKTGTGTHYRKRYGHHGWNAVFFEWNDKRYVMVTFVMNGSGAKESADLTGALIGALR